MHTLVLLKLLTPINVYLALLCFCDLWKFLHLLDLFESVLAGTAMSLFRSYTLSRVQNFLIQTSISQVSRHTPSITVSSSLHGHAGNFQLVPVQARALRSRRNFADIAALGSPTFIPSRPPATVVRIQKADWPTPYGKRAKLLKVVEGGATVPSAVRRTCLSFQSFPEIRIKLDQNGVLMVGQRKGKTV